MSTMVFEPEISAPGSPESAVWPHSHEFNLQTTFNDGHIHYMKGRTNVEPGGLDQHVHYFEGATTLNDGHVHKFVGITGPAFPFQRSHVHLMNGVTTFVDRHIHYYGNYTGPVMNRSEPL